MGASSLLLSLLVARGAVESKMSRDASGQKSVQDFSAVLKDISTVETC